MENEELPAIYNKTFVMNILKTLLDKVEVCKLNKQDVYLCMKRSLKEFITKVESDR